jgi:SHS2 domain-containing protein
MATVRLLDHTGDTGIEVEDDTPEGLFAGAARAMFDIIADVSTVVPRVEERLEVAAPALDLLLRAFLAELLFRFTTTGMIYARFDVELAGDTLRARVAGEPLDPGRHGLKTELKAVTYHQLEVARVDGRWRARVIFDV